MDTKRTSIPKILPVLFGFFVMGFCDIVGIAVSYLKQDFGLSETFAGFIPSAVFLWFLILSIPTALMMNRLGRKKTVLLSNSMTCVGMFIPFFVYDFTTCLIAFALLGIGNTMLQVSLNPLLADVVRRSGLSSALTAGQVVKAVSSFAGPFIALFAVAILGNWRYLFMIYAGITLCSTFWLLSTSIPESPSGASSGVGETFSLLGDKTVRACFFGVIAIVGLDVGMNIVTPKLLIERCGMDVVQAGLGSSVYFLCRTCGAFVGAFLLARVSEKSYFKWNMAVVLVAMLLLFFAFGKPIILLLIGIIGFFASSIFSVLFSLALKARSEKANEVSGLMITGVFGGAIIPPLMGLATDCVKAQWGSLCVITLCIIYLLFCSFLITRHAESRTTR